MGSLAATISASPGVKFKAVEECIEGHPLATFAFKLVKSICAI